MDRRESLNLSKNRELVHAVTEGLTKGLNGTAPRPVQMRMRHLVVATDIAYWEIYFECP